MNKFLIQNLVQLLTRPDNISIIKNTFDVSEYIDSMIFALKKGGNYTILRSSLSCQLNSRDNVQRAGKY